MLLAYVSLFIAISIAVVGQLCLKAGVIRSPSITSSASTLLDPFVIGGLAAYVVAALFYINAIKLVPLSVAFPSVSVSYVMIALFAHWFWGEPFGRGQILGLALISTGIVILGRES